jgi:hypothetical protein
VPYSGDVGVIIFLSGLLVGLSGLAALYRDPVPADSRGRKPRSRAAARIELVTGGVMVLAGLAVMIAF